VCVCVCACVCVHIHFRTNEVICFRSGCAESNSKSSAAGRWPQAPPRGRTTVTLIDKRSRTSVQMHVIAAHGMLVRTSVCTSSYSYLAVEQCQHAEPERPMRAQVLGARACCVTCWLPVQQLARGQDARRTIREQEAVPYRTAFEYTLFLVFVRRQIPYTSHVVLTQKWWVGSVTQVVCVVGVLISRRRRRRWVVATISPVGAPAINGFKLLPQGTILHEATEVVADSIATDTVLAPVTDAPQAFLLLHLVGNPLARRRCDSAPSRIHTRP
jgi:hypothetical protein